MGLDGDWTESNKEAGQLSLARVLEGSTNQDQRPAG